MQHAVRVPQIILLGAAMPPIIGRLVTFLFASATRASNHQKNFSSTPTTAGQVWPFQPSTPRNIFRKLVEFTSKCETRRQRAVLMEDVSNAFQPRVAVTGSAPDMRHFRSSVVIPSPSKDARNCITLIKPGELTVVFRMPLVGRIELYAVHAAFRPVG